MKEFWITVQVIFSAVGSDGFSAAATVFFTR